MEHRIFGKAIEAELVSNMFDRLQSQKHGCCYSVIEAAAAAAAVISVSKNELPNSNKNMEAFVHNIL